MAILNNPKGGAGQALYEITDKIVELMEMREAGDIETDESLNEAINEALEEIGGEFDEKVERVLAVYRNYKAFAEAAKAEKDRLAKIQKGAEGECDRLKGYLLTQMQRAHKKSIKTTMGTATVQAGRPSVVIDDEAELPDGTYTIPTDIIPDKREIKRRIDEGEEVPGAHVETGPDYIVIR